ncbi:MAG: hypothetical protein L6Q99_17250 [Planctomycetes bacterium]|nr:hypothetical protein [Planctomycetota bacterium]
MDFEAFRASLEREAPPALAPALLGLWHDARGAWHLAHETVQAHEDDADCALVHAYLHRKEGDLANARYWYRRAGAVPFAGALAVEAEALVRRCIAREPS